MIGRPTGPWAMRYNSQGFGTMLSVGPTGVALSAAVGRPWRPDRDGREGPGVIVGWMFRQPREGVRQRQWSIGRR